VGNFRIGWREWNGKHRDTLRRAPIWTWNGKP
jgi:pullulanase/glycogen debranching enzyme